jgi:sugar lactone lactonase YvrE
MADFKAELVLEAQADLGEGPVWDDRSGQLAWVDIMAEKVNYFDPVTGATKSYATGAPVGAAALRESGGLIVALPGGMASLSLETGDVAMLCALPDPAGDIRMNDGKCDPAGRFWAGTMAYDFRAGAASLYCFDGAGGVSKKLSGVTISNGLGWSPDGSLMYYVDTMTGLLEVFDYDVASGEISGRRTVASAARPGAFPDGLAVDAEGNIWVALWGGGCVVCFDPAGRKQAEIEVPASQSSCCAFGGDGYADLYITSARTGLPEEQLREQPYAGGLFRVRPGVVGSPSSRFIG